MVGDDVEIIFEGSKGVIENIYDRSSELIRPTVANVTQAFVVFSIKNPDINFDLLNRFLVLCEHNNIHAIVCLNKVDLVSDEENLIGLWLEGQKYFQATLKEEPIINDQIKILQETKSWLERYFKGEKPDIKELSLKPQGSLFRQEVWKLLCEIPYGEVTTYGKIAKVVAQKLHKEKMSGQAVGNAVGHNPISIIIPCHRVVGTSGSLTGYAGGIDKKIALLKHEGVDMTRYFKPKAR
mgnify:CR=1 FL=1